MTVVTQSASQVSTYSDGKELRLQQPLTKHEGERLMQTNRKPADERLIQ